MQWKKWTGLLLLAFSCSAAQAQVVGGQDAFQFLRLSTAPHTSALGGMNVANTDDDIAFAMQNPALMRPALHNQLGLFYNSFYAGIQNMNLQYGYHVPSLNTSFALGVQYLNYGTMMQTDASGNTLGEFSARDYAISAAASRSYGEHWRYGVTLKWAQSALYAGNAAAVLGDVGVHYIDTASLWNFGLVAKNMGVMVNKYTSGNGEPLPFDLQLGISKQFAHLPLRLIATVHHLYTWDIRYNDPALLQTNLLGTQDSSQLNSAHFTDKLFRHFIFGAELKLAKRLMLTVSYNNLIRNEMKIAGKTGLTGFGLGVGLYLNKFQVHYARTNYSVAGASNEIGINMSLNKLFGIGNATEKWHWSDVYPDWLP